MSNTGSCCSTENSLIHLCVLMDFSFCVLGFVPWIDEMEGASIGERLGAVGAF